MDGFDICLVWAKGNSLFFLLFCCCPESKRVGPLRKRSLRFSLISATVWSCFSLFLQVLGSPGGLASGYYTHTHISNDTEHSLLSKNHDVPKYPLHDSVTVCTTISRGLADIIQTILLATL